MRQAEAFQVPGWTPRRGPRGHRPKREALAVMGPPPYPHLRPKIQSVYTSIHTAQYIRIASTYHRIYAMNETPKCLRCDERDADARNGWLYCDACYCIVCDEEAEAMGWVEDEDG